MNTSIGDNAAITFAASFYRAIGFGRSIKESFEQGKVSLMFEDISEEDTPELLVRRDVDPASVYLVSSDSSSASEPTVVIEGPPTAPLGKTTCYTVISQNATRGVWSVGGFLNEPVVVEPLGPSHQIFIEPTDATRVGDNFTIVFTVYSASGQSATARKRFLVGSRTSQMPGPPRQTQPVRHWRCGGRSCRTFRHKKP